ncbi:hypothetical protein PV327_003036 [Microctonus hyperodae]|uniref:Pre-mRNA-splicing factor Syf1-like N-terminal HAT-repeats domain-containing protein n=1 Tax=Microctonus hyperodae TaxID=165561 RepID=A0AA39G3I0_MICHY|nr:hypothetical protein PV327_003036 [Microctonus hyperodae]
MQKVKAVQSKTTAEKLPTKMEEKNEGPPPPLIKLKYSDLEVLMKCHDSVRPQFEREIQTDRFCISSWIKYADWEEKLKFIPRAREIYERALIIDYCNISLWLKYIDMEIRHKQISRARKVFDRAVTILPLVDELWYKYVAMEQDLGNHDNTSKVYERWMAWEPEEHAWYAYIKFELQLNSTDTVRGIYERLILVHPNVENWIEYAKFEVSCKHPGHARAVYERAVKFFHRDNCNEKLYIAYAQFEVQRKHISRAYYIYKYGLKHTAKENSKELSKAYKLQKKKYGKQPVSKKYIIKRNQKKNDLICLIKKFPYNYIHWFDYLSLIEAECNHEKTRRTYEKAIQRKPTSNDAKPWREYIYLWINYATFEELDAKDIKRSRELYKTCLNLIPDDMIMFNQVWLYYAEFEIRQKKFSIAREALDRSTGIFSCKKLSEKYQRIKLDFEKYDKCLIEDESLPYEVNIDNVDKLMCRLRC